jgi:hypothetical protein
VSPEQAVALIAAVTALVVALGAVIHNIGELRKDLNGRMEQLLQATSDVARKQGELAGRDFMRRLATPPPESTERPLGEP